jgi:hypothetical protein
MSDDRRRAPLRRIAGAFGGLFAVVLTIITIQMARGHDPALGTTPKPTGQATAPATNPVQPQTGADGEYYGEDAPQQDDQTGQYQDPQAQTQAQPPPVQSTTS